jgi:phage baseplate assembly protein W
MEYHKMAKYTDIDLYLTKNEITNDINLKLDVAAISQAIKNVALTTRGERLFNPSFGGGLYDMLYSDMSNLELKLKELDLKASIEIAEPRASVQSINITDSKLGYYEIKIIYSPIYDQSITRDLTITVGNDS